jgi:hypothetical protein
VQSLSGAVGGIFGGFTGQTCSNLVRDFRDGHDYKGFGHSLGDAALSTVGQAAEKSVHFREIIDETIERFQSLHAR